MELFAIDHLKKSYGDVPVLRDVSLHVEEGEVVAIIGPSGSGKSTMLRCATTLEEADEGTIRYGDRYVIRTVDGKTEHASKKELREIRPLFGMVFQHYNLFPHLTVLRNITEAPVHVRGQKKEEVEARARELLAMMGLTGQEDKYPSQLSGGQQQRVAIARALAMDPEILFFDEPTSALDPELTGEVLKVIRRLAEDQMTMVIVTHEMGFAREVADRVLFVDGGCVVEEGPARAVMEQPQSERLRAFLASVQGASSGCTSSTDR